MNLSLCGWKTLALAVALGVGLLAPPAEAAEMRLMERWLVNDPLSARTVDHSAWGEILSHYVVESPSGVYGFDYAAVTEEDKERLARYLDSLSRTDVDRLNRAEQRAFWLNAYNALVVKAVLEAWPVKNVNEAGGGLFSAGPWKEKRFRVYQVSLSLDDIVNRILRPIWQDPMTLYGLSCGARGCPPPMKRPFSGATTGAALEGNARRFVNGGQAAVLLDGSAARVSSFYHWYREDFGGSDQAILAHINNLADGALAGELATVETIAGHGFDWSLNAPSRP